MTNETKRCKYIAIDSDEVENINNILSEHRKFKVDKSFRSVKYYINEEDMRLELCVLGINELIYEYNNDLISLVKEVEKIVEKLEKEYYFSITLSIEEERDYYSWFQLNMYRKKTEEERQEN